MELLSKVWPQWKVVKELGEGSFGKVYQIERNDVGGSYQAALKVITIPKNASEISDVLSEGMDMNSATQYFHGMMEEIVKEFAMMERLKGNTNIVAYEDHEVISREGSVGWDILIRMELLTPLSDYMMKHTLGEKDVIKLGIDLCKALELCQQYNIIHRDIKPENIFVSELGDFKLGDFGVARTAEKTMSGMSKKGTYTYMAPEVYKGEAYNATVDLYSLGIVLYRLVNDYRTPFLPPAPQMITFNDRERAQMRRMEGEQFPDPTKGSRELTEIIRKAAAYQPKDRYASPAQMRADLEALLKGEKILAGSTGTVATEDKTVSMFSSARGASGLGIAEERTVAMSAPVAPVQPAPATQPVKQAVTQEIPKKKKTGMFAGIGVAAVALVAGGVLFLSGSGDSGEPVTGGSTSGTKQESGTQDSSTGDVIAGVVEDIEGVVSDVATEQMNILATQIEIVSDNYLRVPEGAEAEVHNNRIYNPVSMLGWWVPESEDYNYYDCENFHPAEGSRIVIAEGEEGPIEVECLPIYIDLQPMYMYENESDEDVEIAIEDANLSGMYHVKACFMENHSNENQICRDVYVNGVFDTHEDTLALGFIGEEESGNVVNVVETHYKISWTGWKLTLTYGDYSMTYVPSNFGADRENKELYTGGGYVEGYSIIEDLGEKVECYIRSGEEYDARIVYYDPELFINKAMVCCNEDGTMTIDTMEESSYDYRYPAKHYDLTYRASQEALTLISGDTVSVYSYYSNPYLDYMASFMAEEEEEDLSEEQANQIVENKNTILEKLQAAFDEAGLSVVIDERTGKVSMDSSILFGHDESALSEEGKEFLDKFLGVYASVILSEECAGFVSEIEVEGHTDTNGSYDYNLVLSKERADSVANYCLTESNSGLDAAQVAQLAEMMTTIGRSYDEPVYHKDGTVNMDGSRRVVFRFRLSTDV